jgi:enhancing lycopene biosynthesis protein 2
MKPRFAVVLSGCGVFDGSEIHEAVLSLLAIEKNGGTWTCFAPDINQQHVINHRTGEEMSETRNVLTESARIARGTIHALEDFDAGQFDVLFFPGGFGAAKNLSDYAFKGSEMTVLPVVEMAVKSMIAMRKPIGALCISPVILAKLLEGVQLTIGNDEATANHLKAIGTLHHKTHHGQVVVDENFRVVSAPCYMLDATVSEIFQDVDATVRALLKWL